MDAVLIKAIKRYKRFAVTMHVNPDADAVGAALSMAMFLRLMGKKARVFNQDACPKWLTFLPGIKLYEKYDQAAFDAFDPEVIVVLDCGSFDRVGVLQKAVLDRRIKIMNIDHHVTNTKFGVWNMVFTKYSSTSEILFQLFKKSGCRINRDIATLLYLGILTDTGSFGFDSTSAHTHEVIAELLRFNFSVSELYRLVYETLPKQDLKSFLSLMNRLELFYDDRVACLTLSRKDAAAFSGEFDLKDKIFAFLRSVKGLVVIVIFAEQERDKTRVNFRSRGEFDVAKLASRFKGGGHKNASGGIVDENIKKAKAKVLLAIKKEL